MCFSTKVSGFLVLIPLDQCLSSNLHIHFVSPQGQNLSQVLGYLEWGLGTVETSTKHQHKSDGIYYFSNRTSELNSPCLLRCLSSCLGFRIFQSFFPNTPIGGLQGHGPRQSFLFQEERRKQEEMKQGVCVSYLIRQVLRRQLSAAEGKLGDIFSVLEGHMLWQQRF